MQFMSRVGFHTAGRCMKSTIQNHGGALLPSEDDICRSHPIQF